MTHVLDKAIAALEGDIRDIRKYGPGVCDPNDDSRSDAVSMVRSKAAALRILRAEREGTRAEGDWWCSECEEALPPSRVTYQERCDTCGSAVSWKEAHEPTPDELRAEGRREERERVVAHLERMASKCDGRGSEEKAQAYEDASFDIRDGDHWRGGEG